MEPAATSAAPASKRPHRWATLDEAAAYLRVHRDTLRHYISCGDLPGYYVKSRGGKRGSIRVDLNDCDALLEPMPAADVRGLRIRHIY